VARPCRQLVAPLRVARVQGQQAEVWWQLDQPAEPAVQWAGSRQLVGALLAAHYQPEGCPQ
jgi:hypothetical protein